MQIQAMEQWEDFVKERYNPERKKDEFRQYDEKAAPVVREFYRLNHTFQTLDFVRAKKRQYYGLNQRTMGVWEAGEYLNSLVDDSDPDTDLSQIQHLLQTAESARRDGRPRWFILAAFLHDLGKVLCLYGEPQWAVVGDTFVTGCKFSEKIVYHEFFASNPDSAIAEYQTVNGIYEPGCGLENVNVSWGHDEYIYYVTKDYMPVEAQYMLRYHSFYPWHREGAYDHLCNEQDRQMLYWVKEFNQYDLYSKSDSAPDVARLKPYYEALIAEFFPNQIRW
jgi:inositol oxygenase